MLGEEEGRGRAFDGFSAPPPGPFPPVGNLRALPASARVLRIL